MRPNKILSVFRARPAAIASLTPLVKTTVIVAFVVMVASAAWISTTSAQTGDRAILTIGSKAPVLDIEVWFSDREGEFEHTTEFEPGRIYIIDFWSTWSTPSHRWMAKYGDLQDRYFDDGVQIIRVSDEDEDSVADFLELDVNGNAEMIYAELTLGYCVTSDSDRSVYEHYMEAAQQKSVPMVFVVGRTGLIEWFGSPDKMQRPLKKIIAGKWDRDAFRAEFLAVQHMNKLAAEVWQLLANGDSEGALKLIEHMMVDAPDSDVKAEMAKLRLRILLQYDGPNIAEAFGDVVESENEDSRLLNEIAWSIVLRQQAGKEIAPELLKVAAQTAMRGVDLARTEDDNDRLGAVLDTHAHLVFLQGDLEKALEIQTEANEVCHLEGIVEYLEELQQEKAKRERDEDEAAEMSEDGSPEAERTEEPDTEKPPADPAGVKS